jgi:hypothetical protein
MKVWKAAWLLVTLATLVLLPTATGWYIQNNRNPDFGEDPTTRAKELLAEKQLASALISCDFLISHDLDVDGKAEVMREEILVQAGAILPKMKSFVWGGLTGNIHDSSSLAGCIAADLSVFGDGRDLVKGIIAYIRGEEVDVLITTLSAIGLATSAAPHIDAGVSVCKNLGRFMSKALHSHVLNLALEAKKLGKLERISEFVSGIGSLWKRLGTGVVEVFKIATDAPSLQKMVRMIDHFGKPAFGAVLIGGKSTLRFLNMAADASLKVAGSAGKRLFRMAVLYPNVAVHLLKITKKAGWDHPHLAMILIAEILGLLPVWVIALIGICIWGWCHWWTLVEIIFFRSLPQPT